MRYCRGNLSGVRCKWFAYGPDDATVTPSSVAPVKSRMVYLSGASLPRWSSKRSLNGCSSCSNNAHWLHTPHFAGELRFASCFLLLPLFQTCASCDQNFSYPPQHVPMPSLQSDLFYHHRCTMFDQISIIFTFFVSKPFESAFPNFQNDWFWSQPFCDLDIFLAAFPDRPRIHLITFTSDLSSFITPPLWSCYHISDDFSNNMHVVKFQF